ncbi:NUDIX domain-containing protein [Umezawaea beigongshangensis]|uniref:NUDIX domain-containing protein n=1 Tax=Umezawaea beigongshangensis TaxID=2780383 RepID=UPI0018F15795|nr:NUDIX hydrolase [Umezawaea beigongshangensis]
MTDLPLRDASGDVLLDVRFAAESEVAALAERVPVPLSLVVVVLGDPVLGDAVLLVFDRHRRRWELPGGTREAGETPRAAAVRELAEETGIRTTDLDFAAIVEFDLRQPSRHEGAAVYRTDLRAVPRLLGDDEIGGFRWWDPRVAHGDDVHPFDAEIARRVVSHRG